MKAMSNAEYLRSIEAYSRVSRVKNEKARSALYYFFFCVNTLIDAGEANILKLLEEGYRAGVKDIGNRKEAIKVFEGYLEDDGLLVKSS